MNLYHKLIIVVLVLVLVPYLIYAMFDLYNDSIKFDKKIEIRYPANDKKIFLSAEDYYNKNETDLYNQYDYREFPNAILNVRKKLLLKDVKEIVTKEMGEYINLGMYTAGLSFLHPNRQIYFFATVTEDEGIISRWVGVDAETGKALYYGKYH